jgi:hypothetical protein
VVNGRQKLIRAIGLPLISLAMFSVAGGHWAVLQTIAWAKMLKDYAGEVSITVAIAKTFSGRNPCDLCLKVKEGRQKEDAPVSVKSDKKGESLLCTEYPITRRPLPKEFSYPLGMRLVCVERSNAPPYPPPRTDSV